MRTFNLFLLLAAVLTVATCKSSTKLYNSGKYSQAVSKAVAKLRSSPGHSESQNTLVKSYPLAVNTAKRDITNALQSNSVTKYDVVINRYEQLNRMAREIYTCPKASQLIPAPEEFHEELRETKEIAAAHYYDLGVRALNERTLKESKTAYQYFVKSNSYVKGYRDVISKMDEAMFAATLHVVVEAPKLPERYQFSADFFYSNLVTEMNKTHEKKYVVFYTPEAAQTSGMTKPHQYIVLDFLEFSIGNVRESKNTQEVKRDNVPVTVEVNGRQTTGTTTVTANFTAFRRDVISGGKLHVRIIDAASNRVTEQRAFEGSYTWVSEWASYTGDDRALSDAQKKMAAQQATLPPPNQDLFIEFTKPIYTQVLTYVRGVYRKYQ